MRQSCIPAPQGSAAFREIVVLAVGCCLLPAACDAPSISPEVWQLQEAVAVDPQRDNLVSFNEIAIGPNGLIAIKQEADKNVVLYDSTGLRQAVVGRPGQGPGEFTHVSSLGWIGDTLWVFDSRHRRASFFRANGSLLDAIVLNPPVLRNGSGEYSLGSPALRAVLPNTERYLVLAAGPVNSGAGIECPCHVLVSGDGTVSRVLSTRVPSIGGTVDWEGGGALVPFEWGSWSDMSSDGKFVATVLATADDREKSRYRVVMVRSSGDTVFNRAYAAAPERIESQDIDRAFEPFAARRVPAASISELRRRVYPYCAPFRLLRMGSDSSVWIGLRPTAGQMRWIALDVAGEPLGSIVLPATATLLVATRHRVWVAEEDSVGLTRLVVYNILRRR